MLSPITADCLAEIKGLRHGFFTRQGGVSTGLYASLNCGHGSKDDSDAVAVNRARVAETLGAQPDRLLTCYQIHSADAVVVTEPWTREAMAKADGLVTNVPGIALGALAADCAPILLADPQARVIAAVHAGWKGALGGVLAATVRTMEGLGARRSRIRAALGPCIGSDSYEVGEEFEAKFLATDPDHARFFRRPTAGGRPHFDLPGFVLSRLEAETLDTVENCSECTYRAPDRFFSFRRATHLGEPDYGRQISTIVLE